MAERITKDNYSEKISQGTVLIDFYSDSCIPCKRLNPVLSELEAENAGKISIYKINTVFDMEVAQKYDVMSTPTLILFKDGAELDRKSGFQPKDVLADWLGEKA